MQKVCHKGFPPVLLPLLALPVVKMSSNNTSGTNGNASTGDDESANLPGSSFSLVRYNNPVLIDKHPETPSIAPTQSKLRKKSPF